MLNVFSEIIEGLGISLLVLATPAVQTVLEKNVRNVRKITSSGMTVIEPMKKDDGQWDLFCDRCWGYTFLKNKPALSKSIRDAWFGASAGNTAFVILAFMLSQRSEIGGCETLDAAAFERTAAKEMAFLQPANAALRSGKPGDLQQFDDLLFDDRFIELRRLLGLVEEPPSLTRDGFDGEHDRGRDKRSTAKSLRPPADWHGNENLPTEDPLAV